MAMAVHPAADPDYPYSAFMRQHDREALLQTIVETVWPTVLDFPFQRRDGEDLDANLGAGAHTVVGTVHITGAWRGTVALTSSLAFATECAAHMYASTPETISRQEVQDAWGELANMIAGNLKALIQPPCQISLPQVIEGTTFSYRIARTTVHNEMTFACRGSRFRVTVLKAEAGA